MAQSLRRPLLSVARLSSPLQRRQFTQIPPRWAAAGAMRQPQVVRPASRMEKSIKVLQKEQMAQGMLPSDVGLLEQTFVPPPFKLTSVFRNPVTFFRFRWNQVRARLRNYVSLLQVKWSSPRGGKRWYHRAVKLQKKSVRPTAVALHKQMYTAFAEGDVPKLREICCDGIYDSFVARIGARKKGQKVVWELVRYNGSPKVVGDRMAQIPGTDGAALRQAVVRIRSRQKLERHVSGKGVEGGGEKDVVEYFVVQNKMEKWQTGEWKVWGTTKETTLKDVERWQRIAKGLA